MRGLDVIGQVAASLAGVFLALSGLVVADLRGKRRGRRQKPSRRARRRMSRRSAAR